MNRTESQVNSENDATYSQYVDSVFKAGAAGISGASAGALIGSAIAGSHGTVVGAIIIAAVNMLLNARNEK